MTFWTRLLGVCSLAAVLGCPQNEAPPMGTAMQPGSGFPGALTAVGGTVMPGAMTAGVPGTAAAATTAPATAAPEPVDPNSLLGRIQANPELSTFVELSGTVGMIDVIRTAHGVTILAPNNAAFQALDAQVLASLRTDRPRLRNTLANHVLMGTLRTSYLRDREEQETLSQNRDKYPIRTEGDTVKIGDATLVQPDTQCPNGILHVIDGVLVPETFDPERTAGPFGVNLWHLRE